jgi:L-ascorbate metabolism protein UlaG (beta-lactamase superfamily)
MTLTGTRVTHSCVLLDFNGRRVLTDPRFSERRGYYRGEALAFSPTGLPRLDGVLVSHGHYDHFDLAGFSAYPDRSVPFVVTRGLAERVRKAGFTNGIEGDRGEAATLGSLRVTATPARHSVPEIGFVVEGPDQSVFFGDDTPRIAERDAEGRRYPDLDVALLPINGLAIHPAFNRQVVMTAEEAAELSAMLRPRVAVPIHYRYRAGPVRDRLLLKYDSSPERFVAANQNRGSGDTGKGPRRRRALGRVNSHVPPS